MSDSAQDFTAEEANLLSNVPPQGAIGNSTLKKLLGWEEDKYWAVRNSLVDKGVLIRGRGKSGSVRKFIPDVAANTNKVSKDAVKPRKDDEISLYKPVLSVIEKSWSQDLGLEQGDFYVENTAVQGRRFTGGKWTRPDIVVVSNKEYEFVKSSIEVTTFEIKTASGFDLTAIYEALSHKRSAHRSYVLVGNTEKIDIEDVLEEAEDEALKHGIGFIVVDGDAGDFENWDIRLEAKMHVPESDRLNAFFQNSSESMKSWVRRKKG